jgi:hypothetical protein
LEKTKRAQITLEDEFVILLFDGLKRNKKSKIMEKALKEYYFNHKEEFLKEVNEIYKNLIKEKEKSLKN